MSEQLISLLGHLAKAERTMTPSSDKSIARADDSKQLDLRDVTLPDLQETLKIVTPATHMVDLFEEWAARHAFDGASFAVMRHGHLAASGSFGNDSASRLGEFASCSKLVTGLCITQLVRDKNLRFDQKMEDIFGSIFRIDAGDLNHIAQLASPTLIDKVAEQRVDLHGIDEKKIFEVAPLASRQRSSVHRALRVPHIRMFPDWFKAITVGELLTHTSGVNGDIGDSNPYNVTMNDRFAQIITVMVPNPTKAYQYQNNNYVVLGEVIEHVTGEKLCRCLQAPCIQAAIGIAV
jgi:CubicO group peptidase (beta-lactamase class C family)